MPDSVTPSSNRACVVVGVGEGLGAALARRFAAGYKVALIARSAEVIDRTAAEIRAEGGIALPIRSDATIEAQIAATYEQVTRELGPIEVLIYNGGRRPMGRLMETTPEVFESTWRLHTFGVSVVAAGGARDAIARERYDSDHRRDRRNPAVADVRGLCAGQVRGARIGASDGARSSSARYPCGLHQCRRRHRHASAAEIPSRREGRRLPQTVGDSGCVLVPCASGSQRVVA
jgi:NAD(P)-dependent dehydrogenase (short-subunit alcohol dehydrogenase family)